MGQQVKKEHYKKGYDDMTRFISYYYQTNLVQKQNPKKVLEIGVGNKTVSNYLKQQGFKVTTCDYAKDLNPDYVSDVRKLPFEDNSFDLVLCCEVLEHIPFDDFDKALNEIKRVTRKKSIISLPYFGYEINFLFKFKGIQRIFKKEIFDMLIKIPAFFKHRKFDGEHYWEMGYKKYSKRNIRKKLKEYFKIVEEIRPKIDTYHYYFILKK